MRKGDRFKDLHLGEFQLLGRDSTIYLLLFLVYVRGSERNSAGCCWPCICDLVLPG